MIPERRLRFRDACRLVPSRFPATGILDTLAEPEDLPAILELESWTNDRISTELGLIHMLPREEWVVGKPMASVVMAAFCHPRPGGGRFNGEDRGAWYAGTDLDTAHAEVIYHRTREFEEIGLMDARVEMRLYLSDLHTRFHDLREPRPEYAPYYDPVRYDASQALGRGLLDSGSNGIVYRSVRREGGTCVACFRPAVVANVRPGAHFEYRWSGSWTPSVRKLGQAVKPARTPRM